MVKTLIKEALETTFDSSYPNPDFRDINIELDYPVEDQGYPAIFISYEDTKDLRKAGVAHIEMKDSADPTLTVNPYTRWIFQGRINLTVVSLVTGVERDLLYDELVGVVAFGNEDSVLGRFKSYIDSNDLIAAILQTDIIHPTGESSAPGTPWGTDEMMFERTVAFDIVGEFIPDPQTLTLASLSRFHVEPSVTVDGVSSEALPDFYMPHM